MEFIEILKSAVSALVDLAADRRKMARLRELLQDPKFQWRTIAALSKEIGSNDAKTRDLLTRLGARRGLSRENTEILGLISRVGAEDPVLIQYFEEHLKSRQARESLRQARPDVQDAE